ncbi:SPOR domain-containing protein [Paenibacillus sp. 19GGS1-52]|uniref:SPOR domain-containing protein n=1 Tax=Paenibacillus sp. 19GGS1-52 TaxID=2758563 RepID=UPI001EFA51BE|nr:SPOR domain-containing protein [Paenibacillus sp. 19GGS1-52]ULO08674.1 SPOR domain-containing protein [Paenibacillus sp. 19GGS1-52]
MNNARMTFRFDDKQDKLKPKAEDRSGSGRSLGTATDYISESLQQESGLLEPTGPVDSAFRFAQEEPVDDAETYYSTPADLRKPYFEVNNHLPLVPTELEVDRYITQPLGNDRFSQQHEDNLPREDGYGGSYHSRRPSYWWKFALSVAGAVVTGVLLGYVALSFFNGGSTGTGSASTTGSTAVLEQAVGNTDSAKAGASGAAGTESAGMNRLAVQVAAQSYYLLQYGVFSTSAGAEQAQQELLDAGLAAALDPADGNRVYAGLSPDREQAKLLSSGLKNQGIELYVREVTLPAAEQLAFGGNAEAVNNYFSISGQLLAELASQSASLLSTAPANAAADTSHVSDLHMQWTEAAKTFEQGLSPAAQRICAELEKSMSQGISALNEYNKNMAKGLLWEVQESMMSFLTGQRQLLSTLG